MSQPVDARTVGRLVFEAILDTASDALVDLAASYGSEDSERLIGVVSSEPCTVERPDYIYHEMGDAMKEAIAKALAPYNVAVRNIRLDMRGKGLTTHGNTVKCVDGHTYNEMLSLRQLSYVSLACANRVLTRNKVYLSHKSCVKRTFYETGHTVNATTGGTQVFGTAAIVLYVMGSGYADLIHDLQFLIIPLARL